MRKCYSLWRFLSSRVSKCLLLVKCSCRKVKLKIRKNDNPVEVSSNFAKVYGLNMRS